MSGTIGGDFASAATGSASRIHLLLGTLLSLKPVAPPLPVGVGLIDLDLAEGI